MLRSDAPVSDEVLLVSVDALVTGLQQLEREQEHLRGVDSWWPSLQRYAAEERNFSHWTEFATEEQFPALLSDFLYSSHGAKYKSSFKEELGALVVSICTLTYSLYKFY